MWFVVFFFLKTYTTRACLQNSFDNILNTIGYYSSVQYSEFVIVYKIASNSSVDESVK